jgi:LysM repeat protein/lipoprotein-anchoring transpeptidase ErfK/SrfK
MRFPIVRSLSRIAPLWFTCGGLFAQVSPSPNPTTPPKPATPKVEPGLEDAVNWKWSVAPSATSAWGMPLPEELAPKPLAPGTAPGTATPAAMEPRPTTYEVKKGDALVKIARKFFMTSEQLKQFNQLKEDRIVIGQVLNIPTLAELLKMAPPPPPPPPPEAKPKPKAKAKPGTKKGQSEDGTPGEPVDAEPMTYEQLVLETVLIQVFLDREMFSPGAIDGKSGPTFLKVSQIYQDSHPDAANPAQLKAQALSVVKQPYASYLLRAEDFKFIKPRDAGATAGKAPSSPAAKKAPAKKKGASNTAVNAPPVPPLSYDEMVAADFLGYTSVWEFVAERFHCDEGFLRELNSKLKAAPEVGTIFKVPNVVPFEIEKALDAPLQPAADPQQQVTAAVVALSRLEISRGGKIVAILPVASARPGLIGRGTWKVLDAIPQPRLSTTRELREAPKAPPTPAPAITTPGQPPPATPAEAPPLAAPQFLPPGPNNPVGIMWIHLAKANSTDPLPYGLHGTSIPARMKSQEGIGGFRLANWDIARAVRLLPSGTALQWKAQ